MRSNQLTKAINACIEQVDCRFEFAFESLKDILLQHKSELQIAEINSILDMYVLFLHQAQIADEKAWIEKHATFFARCAFVSDQWRKCFSDRRFTYPMLDDYVKEIKQNPTNLNLDLSLKVVEITLRDDVIFSDVNQCKALFKQVFKAIFYPPHKVKQSRQD